MAEFDEAQIADAGLAVVAERGAGGLTMRAVADVLGVSPMALYHYVTDKAALVELVVDAAIAEEPLPAPSGQGWQEDVWRLACWMREGMHRRPGIARLRNDYRVWTPTILALGERWVNVWQQSGLELDAAATAAMTSLMAVNGMVAQEAELPDFELPDDPALAWHPSLRLAFTTPRDQDASFELLVRSVIEGLHSRLAHDDVGGPVPAASRR